MKLRASWPQHWTHPLWVFSTFFRFSYFLAVYSIFGDMLDFPLVNARFLGTELPRHWGVSPSNLHAFIVKFPFCCTSQVRRGQNLGCFARFVFWSFEAFQPYLKPQFYTLQHWMGGRGMGDVDKIAFQSARLRSSGLSAWNFGRAKTRKHQ